MVSIPRVVIKEKDNNRMHQVFSPSSQKIVFYCPHGAKKKKKNHLLTQMSNHEGCSIIPNHISNEEEIVTMLCVAVSRHPGS